MVNQVSYSSASVKYSSLANHKPATAKTSTNTQQAHNNSDYTVSLSPEAVALSTNGSSAASLRPEFTQFVTNLVDEVRRGDPEQLLNMLMDVFSSRTGLQFENGQWTDPQGGDVDHDINEEFSLFMTGIVNSVNTADPNQLAYLTANWFGAGLTSGSSTHNWREEWNPDGELAGYSRDELVSDVANVLTNAGLSLNVVEMTDDGATVNGDRGFISNGDVQPLIGHLNELFGRMVADNSVVAVPPTAEPPPTIAPPIGELPPTNVVPPSTGGTGEVQGENSTETQAATSAATSGSANRIANPAEARRLWRETDHAGQALMTLIRSIMSNSGGNGQGFWASRAGNMNISEADRLQAQQLISDDGFFGVTQTTDRIMGFARAMVGENASEEDIERMRAAVQRGFDEVARMFGGFGNLPQVSQDTHAAIMQAFDDWVASSRG